MSSNNPVIKLNLDIASLWVAFFNDLQHLIDEETLLVAATSQIEEKDLTPLAPFMTMHLAPHARKAFSQTKKSAEQRVLRAFLRDSIELTGSFLDQCLAACSILQLSKIGRCTGTELNRVMNDIPKAHHRLHLPQKIRALQADFNVASQFNAHVLSINKARTCVVHRHGIVGSPDVDESSLLKVRWCTTEVVAIGTTSRKEFVLDKPVLLEEESEVQIRFTEFERVFRLGDAIELTPREIHSCIVTLYQFGIEIAQSIEKYADRLGLKILSREEYAAATTD
jgi:hypothetical protein